MYWGHLFDLPHLNFHFNTFPASFPIANIIKFKPTRNHQYCARSCLSRIHQFNSEYSVNLVPILLIREAYSSNLRTNIVLLKWGLRVSVMSSNSPVRGWPAKLWKPQWLRTIQICLQASCCLLRQNTIKWCVKNRDRYHNVTECTMQFYVIKQSLLIHLCVYVQFWAIFFSRH